MKGSANQLDNLHGLLTKYLVSMVQSGKELSPGEINSCINFLKNNHISHNIIEDSDMTNLLDAFKNYDIDNEIDSYEVIPIENNKGE